MPQLARLAVLALLAAATVSSAWHLPLIGPPVPKTTQTSPSLAFLRHSDSSVRLSGRLPSLIVTATRSNVLAALNPRNGSIIWRVVLPETEPIIQHATDLDNGLIGLVSGHGGITVRLINLADGRAIWERHLSDPKQSKSTWLGINGVDVIFGTDQISSTPDLFVASRATAVYRLAGDSGKVRWTWSSSQSLGSVARLVGYPASIPQLEVLTITASEKTGSYEVHVSSLSTSNGELQSTRSHPDHRCLDTSEGPLILDLPSDSNTQLQHSIVCATESGSIASLRISADSSQDLGLSVYTDPEEENGSVIIQDVGLAGHGILVARFGSGQVTVLRLAVDGTLNSVWKFTDQNHAAVFTGSIDRDGLPYVSRAFYSHTLGLGSLEILSVTSTEFTPGGMVTGQTFKHSYSTNGQIQHIAVEVLQITNYVPYSRILVVSDTGTLQQWQDNEFQWERNEDLVHVKVLVPFHHFIGFHQFDQKISGNLGQYLSRQIWELVSGFLELNKKPSTSLQISSSLDSKNQRIWYIGTSTGRLFALYKPKGFSSCKVLWKTRVLVKDFPLIWNQLSVLPQGEMKKPVLVASFSYVDVENSVKKVLVYVDLVKGEILESKDQQDLSSTSLVESHSQGKKVLTVHDKDLGGSPARFLGNRGALFKYHNPNLAVRLNEGLLVEVYDQKLGSLVWSFQMDSKVNRDSVIGALTENWLVLASRDSGPGEMTTVHSIEWYMSSKADVRLDGSSVNLTTCSRAYIVPYAVKALGFSKSRLGVTSRALLVVNEMDQIVSLSRRLLDCRRPYGKPSKDDIEEQLIAYDPVINLDPKTVITADRQTAGFKGVYSFSTAFESTSAVIGVGLDLFASVVAPSRRFDQLGDEFNKLQLILTASGLLAGVLVMRPVVKNKQLKRQWYT